MNIITTPTVYLLGRQQVEQPELDRFLADHGVTWESDSEIAAEVITETAGRMCFDEATEILTSDGWMPFGFVTEQHQVATLSPITKALEFQPVYKVHVYPYNGDLLTYEGRDVSFSVTPEHRQYAAKSSKHGFSGFGFSTTDELLESRSFQIFTSAPGWEGRVPDSIEISDVYYTQTVSNQYGSHSTAVKTAKSWSVESPSKCIALAYICAHYVANGSINLQSGTGSGIVIYGREHEEISGLADKLELSTNKYIDKRNNCMRTVVGGGLSVAEFFEQNCGRGFANKKLPTWVLELPGKYLDEIWNILVRTDGYRSTRGREIFITGSREMANQAQELLSKMGYGSSISLMKGSKSICWVVAKKIRSKAIIHTEKVFRTPYKGNVYCVTTENGVVLVRRNGKVHFSGNCYMSFARPRPGGNSAYLSHIKEVSHGSVLEHAVWTFLITGVSRSLTHELVRHRAGFAYSQLSQRYVDEMVAEYVEPDIIANDPVLHELWQDAIAHAHQHYVAIADILSARLSDPASHAAAMLPPNASKTDIRKAARQAARSVLPNATETKITVTANARALRHYLEQRGSRQAEPEIRKLANVMLDILMVESPNLFGDYEKIPLPDGTFELKTPYPKV